MTFGSCHRRPDRERTNGGSWIFGLIKGRPDPPSLGNSVAALVGFFVDLLYGWEVIIFKDLGEKVSEYS
jgi:hypothetical protein